MNGFFSLAQRSRLYSAVSQRRSVRQFQGEPDVAQMSALHYAAARVCLPGVRILLGDTAPENLYRRLPMVTGITGTRRYAAVLVDENVPHAAIHAGISGEALILEAVSMGLGTCWVAFFKRGGVNVAMEEWEKAVAVIALGVPADTEGGRRRKPLQEICLGDPAAWPLWAFDAAECVRHAPSALNRQPWSLAYAGRTLQLSRAKFGTDLDMGIAMLHASLGVKDMPHEMRWGDGKEIASLIVEDEK